MRNTFTTNRRVILHKRPRLTRGFTLIDTLLGVAIFLVVSSAIFSLVFTTMNASKGIIERQKAANLAREGIEIIENVRNTNILRGVSWATKPDGSSTYPADTLWKLPLSKLATSGELCLTASPVTGDLPWKLQEISCPTGTTLPDATRLSTITLEGRSILGVGSNPTSDAPKRYIKLTNITNKLPQTLKTPLLSPHGSKAELVGKDDIILVESIVQWNNKGSTAEEKLSKILTKWQ